MPDSPHPSKLKPITQFQQHHPQDPAAQVPRTDGSAAAESRLVETPTGQKRPRIEHEQASEGKSSSKKSKGFLPINTFAPSPAPLNRAAPAHNNLHKIPPAPLRASELGDPVKRKRSAAEDIEQSALHGNAVAGPSKLVSEQPKERKLKTFTAFQRSEASPRPHSAPKTPVALKPLPKFNSAAKSSESKPKVHQSRDTPLRTSSRKGKAGAPNSPPRPMLATPPSARASALFNALLLPVPKSAIAFEGKGKESARPLLDSVPPVPLLDVGDDEDETRDGIPDSWSPKKRKGGHVLMGLASRASSLLSSARTAQTLWLHSVSRQLAAQSSDGLALPLLAKLLQPKLRLQVRELLPFGSSRVNFDPQLSPSRRDERKVVLARCKMLRVDCQDDLPPISTQSTHEQMEGLVMFSLHEHPPASNQIPSLPPRRKRAEGHPGRTVFLPANPHDLRLLDKGAEVWVWEPFGKVSLSNPPPKRASQAESGGLSETQIPLTSGVVPEVDVVWDDGAKEKDSERARRKIEEERTERGLVCSRFGIVL